MTGALAGLRGVEAVGLDFKNRRATVWFSRKRVSTDVMLATLKRTKRFAGVLEGTVKDIGRSELLDVEVVADTDTVQPEKPARLTVTVRPMLGLTIAASASQPVVVELTLPKGVTAEKVEHERTSTISANEPFTFTVKIEVAEDAKPTRRNGKAVTVAVKAVAPKVGDQKYGLKATASRPLTLIVPKPEKPARKG